MSPHHEIGVTFCGHPVEPLLPHLEFCDRGFLVFLNNVSIQLVYLPVVDLHLVRIIRACARSSFVTDECVFRFLLEFNQTRRSNRSIGIQKHLFSNCFGANDLDLVVQYAGLMNPRDAPVLSIAPT